MPEKTLYVFYINEYAYLNDEVQQETVFERRGLTFLEALKELEKFIIKHPDGHMDQFGGEANIQYETSDAMISAFIEFDNN